MCARSPLPICVHPAFRQELPALESALSPIAAPLAGTPVMPAGVAQARSGTADPSMSRVAGAILPFGIGNFALHGQTITSYQELQNLQTRFAVALVTPPYANGPTAPGPVQRAVARYLLRQAGDTPEPHLLPPSTSDIAGAARLAALAPAGRTAWFTAHATALRAGTLTPADLP